MGLDHLHNPLSWDIHDKPENKEIKRITQEQRDLDSLYLTCFTSKAGKFVLEHLVKNTLEAATWMSSLDYNKAVAHGFAREGQNALVRMIQDRITRAKKDKRDD